MRKIRLVISYDGSGFSGSQVQYHRRTVQGELERALSRLTGEKRRFSLAGRTDAGVHAFGQVAVFPTSSRIKDDRFAAAFNSVLPEDLRVAQPRRALPIG